MFPFFPLKASAAMTLAALLFGTVPAEAQAPRALPVAAYLNYNGRYASAPPGLPPAVARAVAAANELQRKPYRWGGGHRFLKDRGYDCSGSVSYVLHKAGLLRGPLTSKQFLSYGAPGPGRFISIYVSGDHVFISICGLRFDTSDYGSGRGDGPRWRPTARRFSGFTIRHIPGL
ncbi:hypothetical protein AYO49_01525 [Verrucomicrobiaceae bacterium SCGC AG-212-N21]|nr:hypothetical protein AYO49_01525 [Verrucomicrobiaceae bacterium SCGC AG-212-N21]